ncbi:MAG TPA: hypothetical protein VM618_11735 [Acidimicrobiia bacterium]|nr:hypothetical protein [Acidimicrobiia bacterium]
MTPDRNTEREDTMAISEEQRYRIYEAFRESHGDEVANGLMELLPPVGWADVATKHDLVALKQDLAALEERMALRFERTDARIERAEARFEAVVEKQTVRFVKWTATIAALSLAVASAVRLIG